MTDKIITLQNTETYNAVFNKDISLFGSFTQLNYTYVVIKNI